MKAPKSKLQAPEKHQAQSTKSARRGTPPPPKWSGLKWDAVERVPTSLPSSILHPPSSQPLLTYVGLTELEARGLLEAVRVAIAAAAASDQPGSFLRFWRLSRMDGRLRKTIEKAWPNQVRNAERGVRNSKPKKRRKS